MSSQPKTSPTRFRRPWCYFAVVVGQAARSARQEEVLVEVALGLGRRERAVVVPEPAQHDARPLVFWLLEVQIVDQDVPPVGVPGREEDDAVDDSGAVVRLVEGREGGDEAVRPGVVRRRGHHRPHVADVRVAERDARYVAPFDGCRP